MQEALDGIEFARGDPNSEWGAVRAAMGHPEPFDLRYVAIGNEDCGKKNYRGLDTCLALAYVYIFDSEMAVINENLLCRLFDINSFH